MPTLLIFDTKKGKSFYEKISNCNRCYEQEEHGHETLRIRSNQEYLTLKNNPYGNKKVHVVESTNEDGSVDINYDPKVAATDQGQSHFDNIADFLEDDIILKFLIFDEKIIFFEYSTSSVNI